MAAQTGCDLMHVFWGGFKQHSNILNEQLWIYLYLMDWFIFVFVKCDEFKKNLSKSLFNLKFEYKTTKILVFSSYSCLFWK